MVETHKGDLGNATKNSKRQQMSPLQATFGHKGRDGKQYFLSPEIYELSTHS